jgi:DNA-binding HxlR family transcriptional regulator
MNAALDLLGRRWALRVLWELRGGAPVPFGELRERCDGMSTSVLRDRLVELGDAALVEQDDAGGYALTRLGASLVQALAPLDPWAKRWARSR